MAADAIYAAETKSVPEFPLEISAQKSPDGIKGEWHGISHTHRFLIYLSSSC